MYYFCLSFFCCCIIGFNVNYLDIVFCFVSILMGFFNGIGIFLGMLCFVVMEFLIKKGVSVYGS